MLYLAFLLLIYSGQLWNSFQNLKNFAKGNVRFTPHTSLFTKRKSPLPPFAKGGKKAAFTLAEVLVTMGVIGIVAAMTLPMLTRNYQFYIRQQQFKKAYAALNIAVQKTQIDMGEGIRCHHGGLVSDGQIGTDCKWFYSELENNLQILKTCEGNALADGCLAKDFRGGNEVYSEVQGGDDKAAADEYFMNNCAGYSSEKIKNKATVYLTNSGFSIIPYFYSQSTIAPSLLIDINGLQGPNKWGYDILVFKFIKKRIFDSVFLVEPSATCHALDKGGIYTKHFFEYLYGQNSEGFSSDDKGLFYQ